MTIARLRPLAVLAAPLAVLAISPMTQVAQASSKAVGLLGCAHKLESKPKTFTLSCGDGNVGLVGVTWKTFGGSTARGSGTLVVNECEPNCAAGKLVKNRVRILASKPQTISGKRSYTLIALRANGKSDGNYGINRYGPYVLLN